MSKRHARMLRKIHVRVDSYIAMNIKRIPPGFATRQYLKRRGLWTWYRNNIATVARG